MSTNPFMLGIALLCIQTGAAGAQEITLGDAVQRAIGASGQVAVQELSAREALLDAENARAGRYPQFALSASAGYVSKVMELLQPGRTIRFGSNDSYDLTVSMNQSIYDAGRLDALRLAGEARARMNQRNAEASRLQVEFTAKAAFFRVILAERLLAAAEESRRQAQLHVSDIETRLQQGMALANDVTRARLRVSTADMDIASQRAELERSRAAFRSITGMQPGEPVDLALKGIYEPELSDTTLVQIQKSRPEFAAFDAAEEATRHAEEAARAGLYPSVGFTAGFHYGRPEIDLPRNEWMSYTNAGIKLNWNVWDWGATRREIQKSRISTEKVRENRDDFTRAVQQSLEEALASWHEMQERLRFAHDSADYAGQNLNVITASSRQGMATETDYDNAYTAYTVAQINVSAAEVSVWISAAQVEYVLGIRNTGDANE